MRVLALESSCDETAVAIYDSVQHKVWDKVYSQLALHQSHGGVVPELASRDHIQRALELTDALFQGSPFSKSDIDAVAYTAGPGLAGALLVTAALGRSMAYGLNIPAIGVHHMEGHLLAPMLSDNPPEAPFVALLVSGGHTLLVHVKAIGEYEILGESVDDAAGEAFDKTARLMGLGYPGGPAISRCAQRGNPGRFTFPRPMLKSPDCRMSFSGLKTATREAVLAAEPLDEQTKADIALGFEEAVVDVLTHKTLKACELSGCQRIVIAGGVSANQRLRAVLQARAEAKNIQLNYPELRLCTDNAAMIAYAGAIRLAANTPEPLSIKTFPRWPIDTLPALD
ncbi:MAG: tRNA (adenosine(37)-N6)-threonylcarbamoyltransferase complex transferase subunit TsaD [Legionellales bacterium]|nr:tRNA (adenosine(37)-N6)-threonylcarbamoyltransferase complex transferase subunit TsaD [Legionellales bacterium]